MGIFSSCDEHDWEQFVKRSSLFRSNDEHWHRCTKCGEEEPCGHYTYPNGDSYCPTCHGYIN